LTAAAITELGGQAVAVQFDIADDASVKDLVSAAMRAYGGWTPRTSTRAR
jgi:hypothetical protein